MWCILKQHKFKNYHYVIYYMIDIRLQLLYIMTSLINWACLWRPIIAVHIFFLSFTTIVFFMSDILLLYDTFLNHTTNYCTIDVHWIKNIFHKWTAIVLIIYILKFLNYQKWMERKINETVVWFTIMQLCRRFKYYTNDYEWRLILISWIEKIY